jgi:DNA-binding transcriptional LysR family regulator
MLLVKMWPISIMGGSLLKAKLPSTQSLLAFEAVARHQFCSKAAEELCLTTGAVSKQIRALEETLGLELFARGKHGLALTEAGQNYLENIKPALAKLAEAGLQVTRASARSQLLHLEVPPSFADRWLLPRFADLARADLSGKVMISTYPFMQPDQTFPYRYDAYVCIGEGSWPGCVEEYICGREMMLVASPRLLDRLPPIQAPGDIAGYPILEHSELPLVWVHALERLGLDLDCVTHMSPFDFYSVLIRSATVGVGLAIIPACFISAELAAGELVPVLDYRQDDRYGYFLVFLESRRDDPLLRTFRAWLKAEAQVS